MLDRTLSPNYYSPEFKNIALPDIAELNSGVNIYSFNNDDQKVFKIELNFDVGSNVLDNPAIASLCLPMLREGSSTKSASEISNILDYYGAFLDLKSGLENIVISLYGRSSFINELIPLLADIIKNPVFDETALSKHKLKMSQKLLIDQQKTSYWSPRLLRQNIFGSGHPYSQFISEANISEITRNDLVGFHLNQLLNNLQNISVAGSFDTYNVGVQLQKHFNAINNGNKAEDNKQLRPESNKTVTKKLPNTNQASIALGIAAIGMKIPNYPEYAFLTKVLGGYFGSRLMKKLREEEGLTYGIHAYNVHLRSGSYLQISADVELKSVDMSIELIHQEIEILNRNIISNDELETVKNYMLGEYVNDSNTIFDFADLYKKILLHGLPESYYQDFYGQISSIEAETLLGNSSNYFQVGDFSQVKVI
jgi:predicted Zn-dependent peptidase